MNSNISRHQQSSWWRLFWDWHKDTQPQKTHHHPCESKKSKERESLTDHHYHHHCHRHQYHHCESKKIEEERESVVPNPRHLQRIPAADSWYLSISRSLPRSLTTWCAFKKFTQRYIIILANINSHKDLSSSWQIFLQFKKSITRVCLRVFLVYCFDSNKFLASTKKKETMNLKNENILHEELQIHERYFNYTGGR